LAVTLVCDLVGEGAADVCACDFLHNRAVLDEQVAIGERHLAVEIVVSAPRDTPGACRFRRALQGLPHH
jgi:hypothetical protein